MDWRSQLPNRDVLWGLLLIVVVGLLLWFFGSWSSMSVVVSDDSIVCEQTGSPSVDGLLRCLY
jgi:hypothetical protein